MGTLRKQVYIWKTESFKYNAYIFLIQLPKQDFIYQQIIIALQTKMYIKP